MEKVELPFYGEELLRGQKPRYLLICCADSRMPKGELLTGFRYVPGEVFTISNAGNCYLLNTESFYYAVSHLDVETVIVCGHNDCGMMKAVIKGEDENPHVRRAINTIREKVFDGTLSTNDVDELAKGNVRRQIRMMMGDDAVINAMEKGTLKKLVGLYYDFSSGKPELYIINRNGEDMEEKIEWSDIRDKL